MVVDRGRRLDTTEKRTPASIETPPDPSIATSLELHRDNLAVKPGLAWLAQAETGIPVEPAEGHGTGRAGLVRVADRWSRPSNRRRRLLHYVPPFQVTADAACCPTRSARSRVDKTTQGVAAMIDRPETEALIRKHVEAAEIAFDKQHTVLSRRIDALHDQVLIIAKCLSTVQDNIVDLYGRMELLKKDIEKRAN